METNKQTKTPPTLRRFLSLFIAIAMAATMLPVVAFAAEHSLGFDTNSVGTNGVTATAEVATSPVTAGATAGVTVSFAGTADEAGTFTVGLTSVTLSGAAPATQSFDVTEGETSFDDVEFSFTMPSSDVTDLVLTLAFEADDDDGDDEEPNFSALETAIEVAEAAMVGIYIDTDAANIPIGSKWVTIEAKTALQDAIAAATNVLNNTSATQATVDAAVTALTAAIEAFDAATQDGTKTTGGDEEPEYYTVSFYSNSSSVIASIEVEPDAKITAPKNPTKSGYTFVGWYKDSGLTARWNFASDVVTGNITLYAKWTANSSTGSNVSGGGGGSSSTTPSNPATTPSANVSANGSVSSSAAVADINKAIAAAAGAPTATVKVQNAQSISASTLAAIASAAQKAGKEAIVMADTLSPTGAVQARLYLEPAKLAGIKADIKLGMATVGAKPTQTKNFFEKYFNNNVSVISCEHQGSFGAKLKIAAKVALPTDTSKLVIYSYNKATNTYTPINTTYTIDRNGYIHFMTELAGDIIISSGPLAKK